MAIGPWVRLHGISISQLPSGGTGVASTSQSPSPSPSQPQSQSRTAPLSGTSPSLQTFIHHILSESIPFIDSVAPRFNVPTSSPTPWKPKGSPRQYASSSACVQVYERVVQGKELDAVEGVSAGCKEETWFCRRSLHRDAAENGTASWQEFEHAFRKHHAESEDAFTPTVIGARQAMSWDCAGIETQVGGERWHDIRLVVEEMTHKIDPKPLKNRTFPVVQLSAALAGCQEFLVMSIPITDFDASPYAEFARDKSLVVAAYVSIERIRMIPGSGEVEWIMATASDARGVLPQWMQNLAVPAKVAKDVEMFLAWIPSQRNIRAV
ncbi:hypothetical protein QTJ16_000005 [Diplocarpon rosae]|uniref:DUF3074 domain-containing protein n=1 Tax=Diplocarpon rosae TaxID=946125 RepID=A0AAD9T4I5_9HELO|nr:hypothetical protein QTJ16_000005 [Diplocarpon rosae]